MYDWEREVVTCIPGYYKWNQWFFLQLYKNGLAYRADAPVNWCPSCQTVLANEQVINGFCERCDTAVAHKDMEQWFFKITDYADELLDHSKMDWPDRINTMQTNWIGRSKGVEVDFDISEYGLDDQAIRTFTTRIDTVFGVTFIVLAPEHPLVDKLTTSEQHDEVTAYVEQARLQTEIERLSTEKEKTGVFTGAFAVNKSEWRARPDPGGRLRPPELRHGDGNGCPGSRRARLCLRHKTWAADPRRYRSSRLGRLRSGRSVHCSGNAGQFRPIRREFRARMVWNGLQTS